MMTKSERVLTFERFYDGGAMFVQRDEDAYGVRSHVGVDQQSFLDMGHPAQITVTVEPGDKLNEVEKPATPPMPFRLSATAPGE